MWSVHAKGDNLADDLIGLHACDCTVAISLQQLVAWWPCKLSSGVNALSFCTSSCGNHRCCTPRLIVLSRRPSFENPTARDTKAWCIISILPVKRKVHPTAFCRVPVSLLWCSCTSKSVTSI